MNFTYAIFDSNGPSANGGTWISSDSTEQIQTSGIRRAYHYSSMEMATAALSRIVERCDREGHTAFAAGLSVKNWTMAMAGISQTNWS